MQKAFFATVAMVVAIAASVHGEEALLARWSGKGGKGFVASDTSGNKCHLVLGDKRSAAAPTRIMGYLDFNGLTDYASPGGPATLQDYTRGVTVLAWVYPHEQNLVRTRYVVHQDSRIYLGTDPAWKPVAGVRPDGWKSVTADDPIPLDTWSHLALTHDGNVARLFVNGELAKEAEATGPIIKSGSRPLTIGRCAYTDDNYWCGLLGTVEIFGEALGEARIRERMNATTPKKASTRYKLKATRGEPPHIANGGFERLSGAAFSIAGGWRSNTWGENTSTFSEETEDVHGGTSCQKIEVTAFSDGGVVLCQLGGPRLLAGKRYKLEVWMKGNESAGEAGVSVRTLERWGPTGVGKTFPITGEWRKYRVIGKFNEDLAGNIGITFKPERAGILWVDDVTMTPME